MYILPHAAPIIPTRAPARKNTGVKITTAPNLVSIDIVFSGNGFRQTGEFTGDRLSPISARRPCGNIVSTALISTVHRAMIREVGVKSSHLEREVERFHCRKGKEITDLNVVPKTDSTSCLWMIRDALNDPIV
jgi:hypothetical protein